MLKYSKICVERGQQTSTKFEILKGVSISFCSLSILLNITLIMLHYVTSPSPFHSNIAQWIVPNAWSSSTQVFGFFRLRHFILCTFNIKFVCSKHGLSCQYLYPVCNNSSILHVDSPNISTAAKTVIHLKLNQSATLSAKTEDLEKSCKYHACCWFRFLWSCLQRLICYYISLLKPSVFPVF